LSWAPDGKFLLLGRRDTPGPESRQLWIVPLDGGTPRKTELAAKGLRNAELSADGKTIFFQAGQSDIRIFRTENYLPAND
jgi:dipeptidyl aminopeptidase/acylaminoacyl peptidase